MHPNTLDMGYTNIYEFGGINTWKGEIVTGSDAEEPPELWTATEQPVKVRYDRMWEYSDSAESSDPAVISALVDAVKALEVGEPTDTVIDDYTDVVTFFFPDGGTRHDAPPVIQPESLSAWLAALPKPAAVFGANDLFASEVLAVCGRLGVKVPQQVAVLGCDNDPLIWTNTRPQLTSFQLPFRELGYKAAELLYSLLCGKRPPLRTIRVSGSRLFARASSANIPPSATLVERAKSFIAEHACEGICVPDVTACLGVSRSLLDLRFRQVCGQSVKDRILAVRLAEVRRQLAETSRSILQIGRDCGFNDPDNLKRLFKRRFGLTMRQYRRCADAARN